MTFIRYLSLVKAKFSIVTRRGYRAGKIFVGMRLFCPQEEEKTKREVLGKMRQTTLTGEVAPQGPRGRGIPQGCGHFVNSPHSIGVGSMYSYERGSVSTVVCHLFVVRVPERSAVCSQALCAVSGEASANFEQPSRDHFSLDSR